MCTVCIIQYQYFMALVNTTILRHVHLLKLCVKTVCKQMYIFLGLIEIIIICIGSANRMVCIWTCNWQSLN